MENEGFTVASKKSDPVGASCAVGDVEIEVSLKKDGREVDRHTINTSWPNSSVEALVGGWKDRHGIPPGRVGTLVTELSCMRDSYHPKS